MPKVRPRTDVHLGRASDVSRLVAVQENNKYLSKTGFFSRPFYRDRPWVSYSLAMFFQSRQATGPESAGAGIKGPNSLRVHPVFEAASGTVITNCCDFV